MKVSYSIAVIGALVSSSNAMRFYDDGFTVSSPYTFSEMDNTNREVKEAWNMIEERKYIASMQQSQLDKAEAKENEEIAMLKE